MPNIHLFQQASKHFVADIIQGQVLEISELTWEVLQRCTTLSHDEIIEKLSSRYPIEEIQSVFKHLETLEAGGILFQSETKLKMRNSTDHPCYLCPNPKTFIADIRHGAGGIPLLCITSLKL